jgi:hypothetical protein
LKPTPRATNAASFVDARAAGGDDAAPPILDEQLGIVCEVRLGWAACQREYARRRRRRRHRARVRAVVRRLERERASSRVVQRVRDRQQRRGDRVRGRIRRARSTVDEGIFRDFNALHHRAPRALGVVRHARREDIDRVHRARSLGAVARARVSPSTRDARVVSGDAS